MSHKRLWLNLLLFLVEVVHPACGGTGTITPGSTFVTSGVAVYLNRLSIFTDTGLTNVSLGTLDDGI